MTVTAGARTTDNPPGRSSGCVQDSPRGAIVHRHRGQHRAEVEARDGGLFAAAFAPQTIYSNPDCARYFRSADRASIPATDYFAAFSTASDAVRLRAWHFKKQMGEVAMGDPRPLQDARWGFISGEKWQSSTWPSAPMSSVLSADIGRADHVAGAGAARFCSRAAAVR